VQAAVVDRAPQPGQQVSAYRGDRDGTWSGGYGNGRGAPRAAQCGTGWFGARGQRYLALGSTVMLGFPVGSRCTDGSQSR
jgi:hypothetical protein